MNRKKYVISLSAGSVKRMKAIDNYSGVEREIPEKKGERGMYIPLSPFFSGYSLPWLSSNGHCFYG